MIALVTGASTGIGRDIAVYLSELGYDLIITARNYEKLKSLKSELKTRVKIITADLSKPENAVKLYEECEKYNIDLLVNNAGLGVVGKFEETSLETELELINVNVFSMHVLFKLFLAQFKPFAYLCARNYKRFRQIINNKTMKKAFLMKVIRELMICPLK